MIYTNKQFVRWDDLDALGHVNNASYLTFIQEARFQWSYGEAAARNETPMLVDMVVARAEIDYLVPIYDGGKYFDIQLWVEEIGGASFKLAYEVRSEDGTVHARVRTVQVTIDMNTKKSRRISDAERDFLNKYLRA